MELVRVVDVDLQEVFKAGEEGEGSMAVSAKTKASAGAGDFESTPPPSPPLPRPQYVYTCSTGEAVDVRAIEGYLLRVVSARYPPHDIYYMLTITLTLLPYYY